MDVLHEYGVEFPCGGKGSCGRCRVRLLEGDISCDDKHLEKLRSLGFEDEWRLACLSYCDSDLTIEVGQFDTVIQVDETPFEFEAGQGLGIAFDMGTTTLVGQLLDLESGQILAVETALNPQKKYGSDLISRMEAALAGHGDELVRMIREQVKLMVKKLMEGRGTKLERMVMVGNTAMHHLFCGHEVKPLAFYPFESPHMDMMVFSSEELGWDAIQCERVSYYPSIGSFVGSDILAGILATGMHKKESISVLVDLGTNGEIVVGNRQGLRCASTAAGPAFEGARISQGMQAVTGAISSISALEKGWQCKVIGNVPSKGICGSGLIDAVAVLLQQGLIGEFGEILSGDDAVALDPRVMLTQKDIQEFLLAKAAIAAGIRILLQEMDIAYEQVDEVFVAGGFGNYINLEHVTGIGMLEFPEDSIRKLGNSALMGAKMFLFNNCKDPDKLLCLTRHLSLESVPNFQDIFVENLSLGSL